MNTRTRIKICGIKSAAHVHTATLAGADAIGLVFEPRSPRYIEPDDAANLAMAAGPFVERVGLFTDHDTATIRDVCKRVGLSTVQLHGEYDWGAIEELKPIPTLGVTHFYDERTLLRSIHGWRDLMVHCDHLRGLVIDAPHPTAAGGTGRTFDWASVAGVLKRVGRVVPIILAGGLTPDNVAEAIRTVRPYAVDVSSGVESSRGVKDPALIAKFCEAVRSV